MNLEQKIKNLPNSSGVYQYFDKFGKLLYVGKAKNLKNRVKSYFSFTPALSPSNNLSHRIFNMISQVKDISYIVVNSEQDALILENSLIKQLKPKYNILLRDDKTYPYIFIDLSQDFPRLEITRKIIKNKNIKYFGPYTSGAKDILNSIYDLIPLVQKRNCLKEKKACLFYQIGKCLAPCENKIDKNSYKKLIDEAISLVYNKNKLINKLKEKLDNLSKECRFEEAIVIRDRIKNILSTQITSNIDFATQIDIDVFVVKIINLKAFILKIFLREGRIISTDNNIVEIKSEDIIDEIYKNSLIGYYKQDILSIPNEIIIDKTFNCIDEIEYFLYNKFGKQIKLTVPKRGKKRKIINLAYQNIEELNRIKNKKTDNICIRIKELFNIDTLLNRFEIIDNSHLMGQTPVGAVVVYDNNKFIKEDYRLYNLDKKDEYSQMKEILTRRVNSFDKNPPPDMLVIDGGEVLLKLAYDIVKSVGANIELLAIAKEKLDFKAHRAKGSAKDLLYYINKNGQIKLYKLETTDKRLHFFQKLRDEAHRVAITFFKKQKIKDDKKISLLAVKGIGKAKIEKLLNFFGSFSNIQNAKIEELESVLNKKDAKILYDYFKTKDNNGVYKTR